MTLPLLQHLHSDLYPCIRTAPCYWTQGLPISFETKNTLGRIVQCRRTRVHMRSSWEEWLGFRSTKNSFKIICQHVCVQHYMHVSASGHIRVCQRSCVFSWRKSLPSSNICKGRNLCPSMEKNHFLLHIFWVFKDVAPMPHSWSRPVPRGKFITIYFQPSHVEKSSLIWGQHWAKSPPSHWYWQGVHNTNVSPRHREG